MTTDRFRREFALALVAFVPLAGCATARLNQFNNLAQAGITYSTASEQVIKDAAAASVSEDSALLIRTRADLSAAQRRDRVMRSNQLLRERIQVLSLVNAHAKILQTYFETLAALADPKATDSVGAAAQSVYDSLGKVSTPLKNAKIGGTSVSSFIPKISAPVVALFKAHALNKELKARAGAIAEELALQSAAFAAIENELKTDTQVQQNLAETDNINEFADASKPLPANWANDRATVLAPAPSIASIDAASKAAAHLQSAFTAVVENRLDSAGFSSLMGDISNILTLTKSVSSGGN